MACFDVFNGDADGICALHQLRLAEPREAALVTGVKRDISLLKRIKAKAGDHVTVLDISLDTNRDALIRLLDAGADVQYFDHHFAGDIPVSGHLETHIDSSADICTSLLVNDDLGGAFLPWAVAAAFGDNLFDAACVAAAPLNLSDKKIQQLEQLGTLINYNGYGVTLKDLLIAPDDLYREISTYENPFEFIESSQTFRQLVEGFSSDIAQARLMQADIKDEAVQVLMLPDAPWARRVSGVFGNELARAAPNRAHALMTMLPNGHYRISVRAPLNRKTGADMLCMQFPTGGGRKAAAGINALPADMFDAFVDAFKAQYGEPIAKR